MKTVDLEKLINANVDAVVVNDSYGDIKKEIDILINSPEVVFDGDYINAFNLYEILNTYFNKYNELIEGKKLIEKINKNNLDSDFYCSKINFPYFFGVSPIRFIFNTKDNNVDDEERVIEINNNQGELEFSSRSTLDRKYVKDIYGDIKQFFLDFRILRQILGFKGKESTLEIVNFKKSIFDVKMDFLYNDFKCVLSTPYGEYYSEYSNKDTLEKYTLSNYKSILSSIPVRVDSLSPNIQKIVLETYKNLIIKDKPMKNAKNAVISDYDRVTMEIEELLASPEVLYDGKIISAFDLFEMFLQFKKDYINATNEEGLKKYLFKKDKLFIKFLRTIHKSVRSHSMVVESCDLVDKKASIKITLFRDGIFDSISYELTKNFVSGNYYVSFDNNEKKDKKYAKAFEGANELIKELIENMYSFCLKYNVSSSKIDYFLNTVSEEFLYKNFKYYLGNYGNIVLLHTSDIYNKNVLDKESLKDIVEMNKVELLKRLPIEIKELDELEKRIISESLKDKDTKVLKLVK